MFKSCSPRQTALRDALLMVSGAPVQRVSQTSLHNLLTLEAEEEQPKKFHFHPPKPHFLLPAYSLKATQDTWVNIGECDECCRVSWRLLRVNPAPQRHVLRGYFFDKQQTDCGL